MAKDNSFREGGNFFFRFSDELKNENRFFINSDYLEVFDIIIDQHNFEIGTDLKLYRGRVNNRNDKTPYTGKDIGMPSPNISTSHGRANPYGINYMYLADDPETVIAELRPNIGEFISIGEFILNKEKKVIKLNDVVGISGSIYDKWDSSFVCNFMLHLSLSFSRPIDRNYKELEYLPSQYFAEYCKKKGYEGIMFLSSVMEQGDKEHYNYVFFDDSDVVYKSTEVYRIRGIEYSSSKAK